MEASANVLGQGYRLRVAEDLDGLLGRVHYEATVFAVRQVTLEFSPGARVQIAVQIVGKLADDSSTVQFGALR